MKRYIKLLVCCLLCLVLVGVTFLAPTQVNASIALPAAILWALCAAGTGILGSIGVNYAVSGSTSIPSWPEWHDLCSAVGNYFAGNDAAYYDWVESVWDRIDPSGEHDASLIPENIEFFKEDFEMLDEALESITETNESGQSGLSFDVPSMNYVGNGFPLLQPNFSLNFGVYQGSYFSCNVKYHVYNVNMCYSDDTNTAIPCAFVIRETNNYTFSQTGNKLMRLARAMLIRQDGTLYNRLVSGNITLLDFDALASDFGTSFSAFGGLGCLTFSSFSSSDGYDRYEVNRSYPITMGYYNRYTLSVKLLNGSSSDFAYNYAFYPIYNTIPGTFVPYENRYLGDVIDGWDNALNSGDIGDDIPLVVPVPLTWQDIQDMFATRIADLEAANAAQAELIEILSKSIADTKEAIIDEYNNRPLDIDIDSLSLGQALSTRFPFCIPFDIYNAFVPFSGLPRTAPVFTIPVEIGSYVDTDIELDFSQFNTLAKIVRWGTLIVFNIGLIIVTRKVINA